MHVGTKYAADERKRIGRCITTHQYFLVEPEQQRDRKSFVWKRSLLEVQIGQILAFLRVDHDDVDPRRLRLGNPMVSMPAIGGILIYRGNSCHREKPHTD